MENPMRLLQSLQRSKSSINIMITNGTLKVHTSNIESIGNTIVLFIPRVRILKLLFCLHKKVVREDSKSISRQ
jgi:hypothetical protein